MKGAAAAHFPGDAVEAVGEQRSLSRSYQCLAQERFLPVEAGPHVLISEAEAGQAFDQFVVVAMQEPAWLVGPGPGSGDSDTLDNLGSPVDLAGIAGSVDSEVAPTIASNETPQGSARWLAASGTGAWPAPQSRVAHFRMLPQPLMQVPSPDN